MESIRSKTIARPKRLALIWMDCLVITATVLTFLAVVAASRPHTAHAQARTALLTASDLPQQARQTSTDLDLIGLRIRLATGQI